MSPAPGVVVVGSLNADLTITTDRLPSAGETVAGHDFAIRPGGKGANQAVAAARLGSAVSLVGAVGDDAHGSMLVQAADRDGIDTDSIVRIADTSTGVAVIEVDAHGENSIVVFPGAMADSRHTTSNRKPNASRQRRSCVRAWRVRSRPSWRPRDWATRPAPQWCSTSRRSGRFQPRCWLMRTCCWSTSTRRPSCWGRPIPPSTGRPPLADSPLEVCVTLW